MQHGLEFSEFFCFVVPKSGIGKIFFLTPKMFELKEEEEYKEITDIVINFYLNTFCIKCGYETKEVKDRKSVV